MNDLATAAVVAHDAGAANVILAWFAPDAPPAHVYLEGPARKAWQARFGNAPTAFSLEAALDGAGFALTGSGWSDLEHRARKAAFAAGMRAVAVIDHWTNYPERFERSGEQILPDEIWVTDKYAEAIASTAFPGLPVVRQPNNYMDEEAAAAGPVPADGAVLWIGEPARTDWGRGEPGEFQALNYFVRHRDRLEIPPKAMIYLRPHPSEPAGKYGPWIAAHPGWALMTEGGLADALAGARWVVGLESAALAIALASGRTAISSLPDWAPACRLPHKDIVRLKDLVVK